VINRVMLISIITLLMHQRMMLIILLICINA